MISKEPYLDSSLTIQDLAEQVKIPVKDLSALINLYMNKHFFDFINEYRNKKSEGNIERFLVKKPDNFGNTLSGWF
ncbi:hypothetical protein M2T78_02225 [Elizabethkingia ursingii]|nr:hypothetical protein [Elizabethkingia ursingii]MCL1663049.1 hypothetical protein [Elizabethkingia ursingii]